MSSRNEKCLIGVYFVATATATVLFVVTLAVMVQLKGNMKDDAEKGRNISKEINELRRNFSTIQAKINERRKISKEINELQRNSTIQAKNNERMNATLEEYNAALYQDFSKLRTDVALIQAANIDRSFCSLGVASGGIVPDSNITASSEYGSKYKAQNGRLNMPYTESIHGGWLAKQNVIGQWIQVDLGEVKKIRGVMTQGRRSPNNNQWVTSYKLSCKQNATSEKFWTNLAEEEKVFKGNSDKSSIVTHVFSTPMYCRLVRIYPQEYHNRMSLRMDWLQSCP